MAFFTLQVDAHRTANLVEVFLNLLESSNHIHVGPKALTSSFRE